MRALRGLRVRGGKARRLPGLLAVPLAALLVGLGGLPVDGSDNLWTGAVSSDWNDGGNWSFGGVPIGDFGENAVVGTDSPNIATITTDLLFTPSDIVVTGGGRIDHQAGIAGTSGGAWMFVGQDSTPSVYNLADTSTAGGGISGYAQGTGTLNPTGNLMIGSWAADRQGTLNINTTGSVTVSGGLFIANDNGCIGTMNLESGTVVVLHEPGFATDNTQVGNNGGTGTLNISGGSLEASRNFRVGNDRGTGTVTITGGSLTIGGTDDIFIGRDKGTGVMAQSGGVVTFSHNTFIGNGNNQTDPTSGTYTLSDGVLNVGREFAIGREGEAATGTLIMTGGTINKTGDEKMIVGQNNGKGTLTHSGGTINVNNELFVGNENAGAEGTYTISGTAALNVDNELIVGRESGTGTLNVDGGTITTTGNGNMYIGRKLGTGTLNQTAGTISVIKEFGVGTTQDGQAGIGSYDLSGGTLTATGIIFIGKELGSSGTMTMSGGTMTTSDKLQIGHNEATGTLTQSGGIVTVQNEVYVGNETSAASVGTYTLSGTAELNVGNEVIVGRDNGIGTFNLDGGTVIANKISGGTGTSTVNFNGGVFRAQRDEPNLIENLGTANVASGGLVIDSDGFTVATSQPLSGAGGLEKLGAGSLTLSGDNAYTGPTTVSAGTLEVAQANAVAASAVTVASGASLAVASGTTMKSPAVTLDGGQLVADSLAVDAAAGIASLTINAGGVAESAALTVGPGGLVSLPEATRLSNGLASLAVDETTGGGLVDLGAGQLSIAAGGITAEALRADIIAGRSGGTWSGLTGITSAAAADSGGTRAVGYVVAGDGSARVSYAAPGDTDLSGQVNVIDLVGIDAAGTFGSGQAADWSQGDFNYDGVTNILDLIAIDTAGVFGAGDYFPPGPTAAGAGLSVAAVPEPAGLAAAGLAVAAAALGLRRRWR
jgi:autotransporter-associated beta strand protein/T5SS/PEP-CTERM-associated repeat protein